MKAPVNRRGCSKPSAHQNQSQELQRFKVVGDGPRCLALLKVASQLQMHLCLSGSITRLLVSYITFYVWDAAQDAAQVFFYVTGAYILLKDIV